MAAPDNDNFANAKVITFVPSPIIGTNIEATAEAGEAPNNGKTVWYKLTAQKDGPLFVSTLYAHVDGASSSPDDALDRSLKTVLQVFQFSSTTGLLKEVTYSPYGSWKQGYAGWEFGSYVVFNALNTVTYWIRVDGVAGAEGNFILSWGDAYSMVLGSCSACSPQFDISDQCMGVQTVTDVLKSGLFSFGTFPKGHYYAKYCNGAFQFNTQRPDGWTVCTFIHFNPGSPQITFGSFVKGVSTIAQLKGLPPATTPNEWAYKSKSEAEDAFRCAFANLPHSGGEISMKFLDDPYSDNRNSANNPTFALYKINPRIVVTTACAIYTSGTAVRCIFGIKNLNAAPWTDLTLTLLSGGGVTAPSAAITNVTIDENTEKGFTFFFTAATPNVTATIQVDNEFFTAPIILTYFLGPIINISAPAGPVQISQCGARKRWQYVVNITNKGFWTVAFGTATITLTNGIQLIADGTCALSSSAVVNLGNLNCNNGSLDLPFNIAAPAVPTATKLTMEIKLGSTSFGIFTFPITVPNQ